MAERLHIGAEGYRKIERGETALTVDRLNAIAQILGVSKQEIEEFDITEKITFAHTAADYHSIVVTQFN